MPRADVIDDVTNDDETTRGGSIDLIAYQCGHTHVSGPSLRGNRNTFLSGAPLKRPETSFEGELLATTTRASTEI
jgi:hypothetical protein